MIKLELIPQQVVVIVTIIESPGSGIFVSKIKRYLKDIINNAGTNPTGPITIEIDEWIALWLLSQLYSTDVDGAAAKLMFDIEDSLNNPIITIYGSTE